MNILTFGELMLRLSPSGNNRLTQATSLDIYPGGAEANVAVCLSRWGHHCYLATRLPNNDLGELAMNALKMHGVDTRFIARGDERMGLYFAEQGASLRPSKVLYDRAHSAMAEAKQEDFDWSNIMSGVDWFHFSGITPALSESVAEMTKQACYAAKQKGIMVSCDLNYRYKLWSPEDARKVMRELMPMVDVLIGNEEDMQVSLGTSDALGEWPQLRYVANSLRQSRSASENVWSGVLTDSLQQWRSAQYQVHPIVDRIGSGDAFAAGLIHGIVQRWDEQQTLDFATAASALKHTIQGDFNDITEQEVSEVMHGNIYGRIQR